MPSQTIEKIASASGVAVHGCSKRSASVARDEHRERDLEDGRDHRPEPADVPARVDRAAGVAERGPEQRDLAAQRRPARR